MSAIGPSGTRIEQPEFLTPIAEAQKEGLVPYWLGEEFTVGENSFIIDAETGFNTSLVLSYAARLGIGGTLILQTFGETSTVDDALRGQAEGEPGGSSERVTVGSWEGGLYTLPAGNRPVNQLMLFLDVDGTAVLAVANAGDSGVPGEDPNPLIDSAVLIDTLTQLRPYPH